MRNTLNDIVERMCNLTIAIKLIAEHVGRNDHFRLQILQHGFGRGFVAFNDGKFLPAMSGQ